MANKDRKLHIVFEALALPSALVMLWIVVTNDLVVWQKLFLMIFAVVTLVVDGYLLFSWRKK